MITTMLLIAALTSAGELPRGCDYMVNERTGEVVTEASDVVVGEVYVCMKLKTRNA